MKIGIFCVMVFIFTGRIVKAQEEQNLQTDKKYDILNFSIYMGLTGSVNSNDIYISDNPGYSITTDISFTPDKDLGVALIYSTSVFSGYKHYYDGYPPEVLRNIKYSQFTIGPRFFSRNKNSFIDAGIGYFNLDRSDFLGITLGLGGRFSLSEIYALCIGGRINAANTFKKTYTFYSLNAGIELRNKKNIGNRTEQKVNLSAYAGSYGNTLSAPGGNSFGAEISYDLNKRISLLGNYIYTKISRTKNNYSWLYSGRPVNYQSEVTGGVRYYLKGDNLKFFLEGLSGAYFINSVEYSYTGQQAITTSYFGLTIGCGVEFNIVDDLSGIVKTDVSNYINEGSYLGLFGGLKYSL
jgi:hypothetical protein